LGWRHPGFSTHVGEPIPPNDARAIEDMASYLVRNPVSLKRLVCIDGQQAVIAHQVDGKGYCPGQRLLYTDPFGGRSGSVVAATAVRVEYVQSGTVEFTLPKPPTIWARWEGGCLRLRSDT
jgi:hypothetical protein